MSVVSESLEEKVVEIKRVSKKTKGGNSIRFTALVVVGDKVGKVGYGLGKALDVTSAISKALERAKNRMIAINFNENTIPHEVVEKYKSSIVKLMPSPKGSGIIAGGAVREVLSVCGVKDISAKILGSNTKQNIVICTIRALSKLQKKEVSNSSKDYEGEK